MLTKRDLIDLLLNSDMEDDTPVYLTEEPGSVFAIEKLTEAHGEIHLFATGFSKE